ncbi:hypothetical protein HZS_1866, partial [Henneguya salminicola]
MASKFTDLSFLSTRKDVNASDFDLPAEFYTFIVKNDEIINLSKKLKEYSEKIPHFKYIRKQPDDLTHSCVFVPTKMELETLKTVVKNDCTCFKETITLNIKNFTMEEIFSSFIPNDVYHPFSFETIGHIAHFNLTDQFYDFKHKIGKIVLLKNPTIKTVINKVSNIENEFRNVSFEILAGINDFNVTIKENNCKFQFDYSKVYWNSRLESAHKLIVDLLIPNSLLLDITCGVGAFTIPAAKHHACLVAANDLNPFCFEFLKKNATLNKVDSRICAFNLDGHNFIDIIFRDIDKNKPLRTISGITLSALSKNVHIVINLPELSLTFLPT